MNRNVCLEAVVGVTLLLSACNAVKQNLIVGKWEIENSPAKMSAEFHSDGTADLMMMGQPMHANYKLTPDGEIEWSMNGMSIKAKVNVTADKLELTDDQNRTVVYRRK